MENNKESPENGESAASQEQHTDTQTAHPDVKFRNKKSHDSASERKRRSKNRLSNRRSTGVITSEDIEKARDYVDLSQTVSNTELTGDNV